jgi:serine/threonine protein kinase
VNDAGHLWAAPDDLGGRPALRGERFVLFGKIAEGGMAGIYRAWDVKLRGWRAVKVLLPEFAQRRKLRTRFESEARAMAAIDHPNVVRVFDVVTDAPLPYLVMELAEGGSLNDWLEEHGAMPPHLAIRATDEIARGLAAAHAVGVVHRDVKPQNVLLDLDGRCMVSDFGIARVEFLDSMTRTGTSMGTIGYMAPEQRSDAKIVDARADVYALGALFYKLLTSVVLTDMFMIGHDPELIEPIPEPLRQALITACHHDRDDRFPDVGSFVDAVKQALPALPEDPVDTPPLANPVRETPLDTSSRVFSAISSVLVAMPGRHVPHDQTVPMEIGRGGVTASSWSDESSRTFGPDDTALPNGTRAARTTTVTHAPSSVTPGPAALQTPGSTSHERQPTLERNLAAVTTVAPRKTSWLAAGAASLLGVGLVLGGAFGFSLWTVRLAHRRELAARSALYQAIEADRPALDLVNERSTDPSRIALLLEAHAAFTTTSGEPAKQRAADAFVVLLLEQGQPFVADGTAGRAAVQIQNLALTQEEWHVARESLHQTRSTAPGVWAATFGF